MELEVLFTANNLKKVFSLIEREQTECILLGSISAFVRVSEGNVFLDI
jgi:hypothetical protein